MQTVVVHKSKTVSDYRLDAECYQEKYLAVERALKGLKPTTLGAETSTFCKGVFDIKSDCYADSGVPFVRIGDMKGWLIDESNIVKIPVDEHKKNKKTALCRGDVILSKTAYAAASYVNLDECNTSQDTIAVKLRKSSPLKSEFLVVFLNCKHGLTQMQRWFTGNVQMHLNLSDSKGIMVPVLSQEVQGQIGVVFQKALSSLRLADEMFGQAESILLKELGMLNWKPTHQLSFIKSFSASQDAGRFDAEYFQPKYEEIENAIKSYAGGYALIGSEFKQNKSSVRKVDDAEYQYVEIGSVSVTSGTLAPSVVLGADLPANAKRVLKRGDVLVSKVRTYRGAIAIVDADGYIGSGAFCILHENGRINKETLLAFLHSKPMLAWSLKPNTGTSYPVIVDDDILNCPIPLFPKNLQDQIKKLVLESFDLRKQSKHLLECAKRAVEMAIESDEQTAVNWLETEIARETTDASNFYQQCSEGV